MYIFKDNQTGCVFNLTDAYNNITSDVTVDRNELFVTLNFHCYQRNDIHFTSFRPIDKQSQKVISVQIALATCNVFMQELHLFQNYGRIWSIVQSNTSTIYPNSNCSCISGIQILSAQIVCSENKTNNKNGSGSRFFWEFCEQSFETLFNLHLYGCASEYYEIEQNLLEGTFPNLQTLILELTSLTEVNITFPWTPVYIDTPEDVYVSYLTSHYKSVRKSSRSFPRSIEIRTSDVNINDNLYFNGDINSIAINQVHMSHLDSNTFRNVSGLQYLYLKSNELTSLPESVFNSLHSILLLDLSNNKINSINQHLLKQLLKLQELFLQNNELTTFPAEFLKDQMHSIKRLVLAGNPLVTIPVYPMYAPGLKYIDISHCRINSSVFMSFIEHLNHQDVHASYIDSTLDSFQDSSHLLH